jgi:hypothetical protein
MSASKLAGNAAAAIVGAIVGGLVVLAAGSLSDPPDEPRPASVPKLSATTTGERIPPSKTVLLAWKPQGLPSGSERRLETTSGVRAATTVIGGLDWLSESHAPDGTPLDQPRPGFAIPLDVAIVEPAEYAEFVPPSERELVLALGPHEALLAATEAGLRSASEGTELELGDETVRVAGIISDEAASGYEVIMRGPPPQSWARLDRFVLMHVHRASDRNEVAGTLRDLLGPGGVFRIRARGETPFLRYGDAVLPMMLIKQTFGEFSARPLPDGTIEVDPEWRRANIRQARVPLLGTITCNRVLLPQLRRALREVNESGLAYTVDQFSGCYNARFISRDPAGRLSHHSWGMAVDINAGDNPFGTKPDQDARLVEIMEDWGFTWGGRWLVPDGMHFEWVRFP